MEFSHDSKGAEICKLFFNIGHCDDIVETDSHTDAAECSADILEHRALQKFNE